ncbi:putative signal peptide protein [Puccinia sorghi]|uniref:Putative signal peptide protein n=1 Tax=Puccinia sorghi TaxID=27349 RepID=A0A0L6VMG1_9BASI|nr:putative signal peptide protein [Puccinia sorghi]
MTPGNSFLSLFVWFALVNDVYGGRLRKWYGVCNMWDKGGLTCFMFFCSPSSTISLPVNLHMQITEVLILVDFRNDMVACVCIQKHQRAGYIVYRMIVKWYILYVLLMRYGHIKKRPFVSDSQKIKLGSSMQSTTTVFPSLWTPQLRSPPNSFKTSNMMLKLIELYLEKEKQDVAKHCEEYYKVWCSIFIKMPKAGRGGIVIMAKLVYVQYVQTTIKWIGKLGDFVSQPGIEHRMYEFSIGKSDPVDWKRKILVECSGNKGVPRLGTSLRTTCIVLRSSPHQIQPFDTYSEEPVLIYQFLVLVLIIFPDLPVSSIWLVVS